MIDCSSSDVKKSVFLFLFWMLDLFFLLHLYLFWMLYTANWLGCYLTLAMFTIKYTICGEILLSQLHSVLLFAAFCLMPIWSRTCKIESSMQILTLLSAGMQLHCCFAAFYSPEPYEWLCARSANYFFEFYIILLSPETYELWSIVCKDLIICLLEQIIYWYSQSF